MSFELFEPTDTSTCKKRKVSDQETHDNMDFHNLEECKVHAWPRHSSRTTPLPLSSIIALHSHVCSPEVCSMWDRTPGLSVWSLLLRSDVKWVQNTITPREVMQVMNRSLKSSITVVGLFLLFQIQTQKGFKRQWSSSITPCQRRFYFLSS